MKRDLEQMMGELTLHSRAPLATQLCRVTITNMCTKGYVVGGIGVIFAISDGTGAGFRQIRHPHGARRSPGSWGHPQGADPKFARVMGPAIAKVMGPPLAAA